MFAGFKWLRLGAVRAMAAVSLVTAVGEIQPNKDLLDGQDSSQRDCEISRIVTAMMQHHGIPGMCVCVRRGREVLLDRGYGLADVENSVLCRKETLMRIASISKPLTSAAIAKLYEQGKIDLDRPVQQYVPSFPSKEFNGRAAVVTTRSLLGHLAGVRHYGKVLLENGSDGMPVNWESHAKSVEQEFTSVAEYPTVESALEVKKMLQSPVDGAQLMWAVHFQVFKDDPLISEPGKEVNYTTYGFVLLSRVVEAASGETFLEHMARMFAVMGMSQTCPDRNEPILMHRASQYRRHSADAWGKEGILTNAPPVNCSNKWGGGGFLSTASDIARFGSLMLTCCHADESAPSFIRRETLEEFWQPMAKVRNQATGQDRGFASGWMVLEEEDCFGGLGRHVPWTVYHTGGAVGGSSVLLLRPGGDCKSDISVAILANLEDVQLTPLARQLADIYGASSSPPRGSA